MTELGHAGMHAFGDKKQGKDAGRFKASLKAQRNLQMALACPPARCYLPSCPNPRFQLKRSVPTAGKPSLTTLAWRFTARDGAKRMHNGRGKDFATLHGGTACDCNLSAMRWLV